MKTTESAKTFVEKSDMSAQDKPPVIDAEVRNRTIAEAAYYRAEARGFAPGFEVEDWLEAEAEVDGSLQQGSTPGALQDGTT